MDSTDGPTRPAATGSAEPDYAELERLARAATPGPWRGTTIGNYDQRHAAAAAFEAVMARRLPDSPDVEFSDLSWVLTADESLNVALVGNGANGPENAAYIAAASPDVVLRLLARRAPGDRDEDAIRRRLDLAVTSIERFANDAAALYPEHITSLQFHDLTKAAANARLMVQSALRALAADSRPEERKPTWPDLATALIAVDLDADGQPTKHPDYWRWVAERVGQFEGDAAADYPGDTP